MGEKISPSNKEQLKELAQESAQQDIIEAAEMAKKDSSYVARRASQMEEQSRIH